MSSPISIHSISELLTGSLEPSWHDSPRQRVLLESYRTEPAWKGSARMSAPLNKVLMCIITVLVCWPSMHPFQTSALLSGRSRVD
jgi:hypothetical protein